jgi:perosamine synthetase
MIDLIATIGLGNLRRLEKTNARRRVIQERYNKAFSGYSWFKAPEYSHTVQYYTPKFWLRDSLSEYLASKGIHTSVHFKPVSEMTYWKKAKKNPLPNTDEVWVKLLSLPVHNALTNKDQDYVIQCVKEFYA